MRSAIVMAAMLTSCATAMLTAKCILHIVHFYNRDDYKRFCRNVIVALATGGFRPKYIFETLLQNKLLNLSIQQKYTSFIS